MSAQPFTKWRVLAGSTIAFTVCFAIWMMFAVIAVPIKKTLKSTVCARP
jgi:NNP family nitrate/nitrite transporter-like MFS transporter